MNDYKVSNILFLSHFGLLCNHFWHVCVCGVGLQPKPPVLAVQVLGYEVSLFDKSDD
jgi:hypothetical protein